MWRHLLFAAAVRGWELCCEPRSLGLNIAGFHASEGCHTPSWCDFNTLMSKYVHHVELCELFFHLKYCRVSIAVRVSKQAWPTSDIADSFPACPACTLLEIVWCVCFFIQAVLMCCCCECEAHVRFVFFYRWRRSCRDGRRRIRSRSSE